jgi:uncharacterized protein (DUF58 family)
MSLIAPAIASGQSRFLELGALQPLARLRFSTNHKIEGAYSGRHLSRQRGGSSEFVDYREYTAGEDLRRIDWKVLGRTGRPYVRLFQDETNLRCTIMIDASSSMLFRGYKDGPGQSKLEYVQYLATALSYLISSQRDQVGLAVAADGLVDFIAPAGTATHIHRLQQTVEKIQTKPVTDLTLALRQSFDQLQGRGILLVMSDFLVDNLDGIYSMLRLFRHRRWQVLALHIVHPEEERLPDGRAYRFEGMENDGLVDCTPAQVREAYESAFAAHLAAVRGVALSAGCDYRQVSTAIPYLQTLFGFLVEHGG